MIRQRVVITDFRERLRVERRWRHGTPRVYHYDDDEQRDFRRRQQGWLVDEYGQRDRISQHTMARVMRGRFLLWRSMGAA